MTLASQLARAVAFDPAGFVSFGVRGQALGWIAPSFARTLLEFGDTFESACGGVVVRAESFGARSEALERVARLLAARGIVSGWRDERYTAFSPRDGAPMFELERAAWRRFGLHARAAHLNAYVDAVDGLHVWAARRSPAKPIDPGMLDNLVGGGIGSGMDARGTLIKECWEEAGIGPDLAAHAAPAGVLRVRHAVQDGLHDESLFVFDLALAAGFRPSNQDGEVAGFMLLGAAELAARLAAGEFTVDAGAVAIDFLSRRGALRSEPALAELLGQLRAG